MNVGTQQSSSGGLTMDHGTFFIVAIPTISIIALTIYQVFDEMRRKNFFRERRTKKSADQPSVDS
jgi:hypothetical protein